MSKEIFVAFATQKGGIGKSTVTALAASYLHNVKGYNVAVVDCDDPQHSIHGLREHEMGLIDSSTYFKALACDHFRRIKKNAYTIVKSNAVNALDDAERMIATEDVKPDVVFFDMPGTLRSNGVIKTLSQMDYIFTPLSADRFGEYPEIRHDVPRQADDYRTGENKGAASVLDDGGRQGEERLVRHLRGSDSRNGLSGTFHPLARQQEVPP